ncbi:MAG TPA: alginate lyase family protein [Pyrinomonadaceae bacterium]|nr:alginate lyase family protein [Pyrinomonadaceae bacterium]
MNLQKIRNASLRELRVRAAQRVAAFRERRGWSTLARLPSDGTLRSLLNIGNVDYLEYFRIRSEPRFFADPRAAAMEFKSRWPHAAQQLIEQADRITLGRFDLLGLRELSFGHPIDWHFEPVSGKRIPILHWSKLDYLDAELAGDKKVIWELNRHQYFVRLGQAYCLTGDERYARVFASHLEGWLDANPPKLGVNWASSLEVAFRSISWLWAFYFFKSSPSLSLKTFKRAVKYLYLSARHLESYLSTYFSPNTHLTGEALGLFYLGTLLPEFKEAKRWQATGSRILIDALPVHVQKDGVYFEQSSYYHRYTTDFYIHFLLLARANGFALPNDVEKSLALLLDHLMYITRPDGTTPLFGDDDGGRLMPLDQRPANDFRATLATGSILFNRGDLKFVADDATEELVWLVGVEGLKQFDSIPAQPPAKLSQGFLKGGYFVMRDGWSHDSNYLLFDCGPHGALNCGHAHADALSIDLAVNGHTMLVDPGTYTYTGSKELRDWFRSSQAHNTVTIDGESSSIPNEAFSWKTKAACTLKNWITTDRLDFVSGTHDGFQRLADPVSLERSILFLKHDYFVIRDLFKFTSEHRADVWFHFDPSSIPSLEAGVIRETHAGFSIQSFGNGHWIEEEASVSHCYAQKERAPAYAFSASFRGEGEIVSFLLPWQHGIEWRVTEIEVHGNPAFVVSGAKTLDLVMIRATDWLWVRFLGEKAQEIVTLPNERTLTSGEIEDLYSVVKQNVRH